VADRHYSCLVAYHRHLLFACKARRICGRYIVRRDCLPLRPVTLRVFVGSAGERDSLEARRSSVGFIHREFVWIRHILRLACLAIFVSSPLTRSLFAICHPRFSVLFPLGQTYRCAFEPGSISSFTPRRGKTTGSDKSSRRERWGRRDRRPRYIRATSGRWWRWP